MRRSFLVALLITAGVSLASCAPTPGPLPFPVPPAALVPAPATLPLPSPTPATRPAPAATPVLQRPTPAPAGWKPEVTGGARLKVSAESEDAGTLVYEEQVLAGFLLTNVGDAPLVMTIPFSPRLVEGC